MGHLANFRYYLFLKTLLLCTKSDRLANEIPHREVSDYFVGSECNALFLNRRRQLSLQCYFLFLRFLICLCWAGYPARLRSDI